MPTIKVGIVREAKFPPDARVPLTPLQIRHLKEKYPHIDIVVQPSLGRCYADYEYEEAGAVMQEDLHDRDVLFGVKEVPYDLLIPNKTYLFFSHTIKKQPHNKKLLQNLLQKQIRMIDYECLKDADGIRVIAFGRWAGIIGAHNAIWTLGMRLGETHLRRARDCRDYHELKFQYKGLTIPTVKMIVTGTGRVGKGAVEFMREIGIREVDKNSFLRDTFQEAVFCVLDSEDLYVRKDNGTYDRDDYHAHPDLYKSVFQPYVSHCDVLINCIFWHPTAPRLFEKPEMDAANWRIRVIADVSCDVHGGIPATIRSTTINEPVFGYDVHTDSEIAPYIPESIDIMAIDNLPNELPRSASEEFGNQLIAHVWDELFAEQSRMIHEATICKAGALNAPFAYLQDYVGS